MSITLILDKNITTTYLHHIYHYIKRESVYFTGIKVFNNLQQSVKNLSNDIKQFKSALKNYLHAHSFYCIDEYFSVNREWCKIKLYLIFKLKLYVMYITRWLVLYPKVLTCLGFIECK
jgi:hypothetical protein